MSVGDLVPYRGARRPRELRDPSAATMQLRFAGKGQPQVFDWNAENAIRYGYLANVVAYRCMTVNAETLAARAFRTGLVPPERPGLSADFNTKSQLARLLGPAAGGGAPNPEWSPFDFWAWTFVHRQSTGRYAWEIETTRPSGQGEVVALWPLVMANFKPVPTSGGNRYFSAFRYGRPGEEKTLASGQVLYGWNKSHRDVRQATAPLEAARYALSIALASDQHQYGFLRNGAVPEFIVGVEAFADADQFEAFKRQWNGDYQGPENRGRTHFVELDPDGEGDLSKALFVQTVGMSAKEGKIPEQYMTALQQIAIDLGVPWSKLDASGRTFDNARQEDRDWWSNTLLPMATRHQDEVNTHLASRLGVEVGWFDLSDVEALQPIPPATAGEIPALIAAGVVDAEEARPWLGLTGPAPERPEPEPLALPPGPTDEDLARLVDLVDRERREAVEQAERALASTRATVDQEARRGAIWRATDAVIAAEERRWERAWSRLFTRQEKATISRLEGGARSKRWQALAEQRAGVDEVRGPADGLFDPAFWLGETTELAHDLFEQLAGGAFARLSGHFGVSFELEAEFAQTFIQARANQLAGQVTDTTYRAIVDALAAGVAEGESVPDLAKRIREVFGDAAGRRAEVIARTEVISGHNAAAVAAASSLPGDVVAGQQWIATRDGRTRDTHLSADGQIVPVGQPFAVGGVAGAYPGDPGMPAGETVNCRCTVAFLTPDEFAAEVDAFTAAAASSAVPVGRARMALAMLGPGEFDEARFRQALVAAA